MPKAFPTEFREEVIRVDRDSDAFDCRNSASSSAAGHGVEPVWRDPS